MHCFASLEVIEKLKGDKMAYCNNYCNHFSLFNESFGVPFF